VPARALPSLVPAIVQDADSGAVLYKDSFIAK
jgi:hypothetical protein